MSEVELARALLLGKPYFGSAMAALQGPPIRHCVLDSLVREVSRRKKRGTIRILEVGSWAGASAVTFGAALRSLQRKVNILCVDLWKPCLNMEVEKGAHYAKMNEAAECRAIFQLFRHNLLACKMNDIVNWQTGNSSRILPRLRAKSFDLIYIDGSHIHKQVLSDIRHAKKLIDENGIIAGDNLELEWNEIELTAHKVALDLEQDYVRDPRAEQSYHPGVTQAVHESFPKISRFEGVWAVTRSGAGWTNVILSARTSRLPRHIAPFTEQRFEKANATQTE